VDDRSRLAEQVERRAMASGGCRGTSWYHLRIKARIPE
jgi:hypothetical protein